MTLQELITDIDNALRAKPSRRCPSVASFGRSRATSCFALGPEMGRYRECGTTASRA